jgi:hypothetical protein
MTPTGRQSALLAKPRDAGYLLWWVAILVGVVLGETQKVSKNQNEHHFKLIELRNVLSLQDGSALVPLNLRWW